ncbi:MAG TPA: ribosome assembly RNA-binding protein YhbY [Sedimentibacter sp.]|jgi:RNA-binding protein|nr:ribosome assembly RNA-binding protein YhbY [Sedimentibacter sp.]NLA13762.1 ribosome assembly RNA-binding protein YhbY [Tissierellia bacterium]HAS91805.1 ribosome assembly RNA-binding protein YhbY [Clostridiales bacterium]HOA19972.1 ribosome assembly RNA-binding protein YhbY [Sedimentibacter sp.]HOG63079.1 ribosome assembly RNA-binding protein YhbY [Sedimentibacter sp.]
MLTGKQRSYLKALANSVDTIMQIGKGGITDSVLKQIDDALNARELIKVSVLKNSMLDAKSVANEVAESLGAEYVQSIGGKFVLYRESKEKKINIPK